MTDERIVFVGSRSLSNAWPRQTNLIVQSEGGSWRVRLRCPDGKIRRFKTSRVEPKPRVIRENRAMSTSKRYAILARDGFRCRYCGRSAPDVKLHVDHVVALVNGGTSDDANLVAACEDCNLGKSTA